MDKTNESKIYKLGEFGVLPSIFLMVSALLFITSMPVAIKINPIIAMIMVCVGWILFLAGNILHIVEKYKQSKVKD